jgi:Branched-chain amino acid ATP-binding cassette transporter
MDTVTVLDYGQVIASDNPAVIQNDPRVIEAYFGTSPERAHEGEIAALRKGVHVRMVQTTATIHSNALLLGTILRNLVNNAIKYTQPGGRIVRLVPAGELTANVFLEQRPNSNERHRQNLLHFPCSNLMQRIEAQTYDLYGLFLSLGNSFSECTF